MKHQVVMKVLGLANGQPCLEANQYVKSFDPEAYNGRGHVTFTQDVKRAKVFDNPILAYEYWNQVPKSKPHREDGRPNKPLTAYHMEFIPLEEAK